MEVGRPAAATVGAPTIAIMLLQARHAIRFCMLLAVLAAGIVGGCGGGGGDSAQPAVPGRTVGGAGDDIGSSVRQTSDGGFIIAGSTTSTGAGGRDVYLVKTDSAGTPLWTRTFGGSGDDYASSVSLTSDGGYIIAGSTNTARPGLTHGGYDVYLIKTDADGSPSWEGFFGGAENDYGSSVLQTSDGGYIVAGTHPGTDLEPDAYLIKTDSSGTALWEKTFGGPISYPGGTMNNWWVDGLSLSQTADGGFVLTGRGESLSFDPGGVPIVGADGFDIYLARTDGSGNLLWEKTLGGSGNQRGLSVRQTADGGYVVAGSTDVAGNDDVYLVRTDSSGAVVWTKTLTSTSGGDYASDAQQTPEGGFIVTGAYAANNTDMYLARTDASGNVQWAKTFGANGFDVGASVQQRPDGGFVVVGSTTSSGAGGYDVYFVRTDGSGNAI